MTTNTPRCGLCEADLTGDVLDCACMRAARTMPTPSALYEFVRLVRAGHTAEHAADLATGRAGEA